MDHVHILMRRSKGPRNLSRMIGGTDEFSIHLLETIKQIRRLYMQTSNEILAELQRREATINRLLAPLTPDFVEQVAAEKNLLDRAAAAIQILKMGHAEDDATRQTEKLMQQLELRLKPFTTDNTHFENNNRLLYQEAGQWARHFSIIRMTVMTFTVSASTAIIAYLWKGDEVSARGGSNSAVAASVAILWTLGLTVFWLFTFASYTQLNRQQKRRPLLPTSAVDFRERKPLPRDWASLVVALPSLCLALGNLFPGLLLNSPFKYLLIGAGIIGLLFFFVLKPLVKWSERH